MNCYHAEVFDTIIRPMNLKLLLKKFPAITKFPHNILLCILFFAFLIRVFHLNYNSPFIDEAFYIISGLKILNGQVDAAIGDISWIGGFPFFYPLLSGIFYSIGGILAARFFTVILGTISIYLIFRFTKNLKLFKAERDNLITGLVAALLMATTTIPIAASRLAIYDGLSFTLFLFALMLFVQAIQTRNKHIYFLTSLVLFLSFLTKYIVAIFFPLLFLLPFCISVFIKKSVRTKDIVQFFWIPLILLIASYALVHFENLSEFFLNQAVGEGTTSAEVATTFWQYTSVIYIAALLGVITLWKSQKTLSGALIGFSLIPLLVHVLTKNNFSMHQHTFLSLLFLFPLAGAFFTLAIKKYFRIGLAIIVLFLFGNIAYSARQVYALESFWPNSSHASTLLKTKVTQNDYILAEGGDTILIGMDGKIDGDHIIGPFVFDYKNLENEAAYIQAITDGYFRFVELEDEYFSDETIAQIEKVLPQKYAKIYDDGRITVYERT